MFSFFFFKFIFLISWRLITLQYCSGFCHTSTWISHEYTCMPHPDPPSHLPLYPIPLGLPSAPGPSTWMHETTEFSFLKWEICLFFLSCSLSPFLLLLPLLLFNLVKGLSVLLMFSNNLIYLLLILVLFFILYFTDFLSLSFPIFNLLSA